MLMLSRILTQLLISFSSFFHASFSDTYMGFMVPIFWNCTQDKRDLNTLIRPELTAIEYASHKFLFFGLFLSLMRFTTQNSGWNLYFMHSNIDWLINRLYIWIKHVSIYCSLSKWEQKLIPIHYCLFTSDITDIIDIFRQTYASKHYTLHDIGRISF